MIAQQLKNSLLILSILFIVPISSWGQGNDQRIGDYYYQNGEYEKALEYYEKKYDQRVTLTSFKKYFKCLVKLEDYKQAERIAKKQTRKNSADYIYALSLGKVYNLQGEEDKAQDVYKETIKNVAPTVQNIIKLGKLFKDNGQYDMALRTFEKGRKNVDSYPFEIQVADVYAIQGKIDKMVNEYLNLVGNNRAYVRSVKNYLTRYFDFEDAESENVDALRIALLKRIRKNPERTVYNNMLIWLFIQQKDFSSALRQTIALDKREDKNGKSVISLARMATQNRAYDMASKAYQYIIDQGNEHNYFITANTEQISIKYDMLQNGLIQGDSSINALMMQYDEALNSFGWQRQVLSLVKEYAKVMAYYAGDIAEAKKLINDAFEKVGGLPKKKEAELKILLADIMLLQGDIWDSSLYYMQVEEDYKQDRLGHLAKFKNAKLYYYAGQFDWAKAQLDVLKASTSKLIANDAMQLSLLIADNFNMDTTQLPMEMYASADLLVVQHRYEDALKTLDSLEKQFPFHSLVDEIMMLRGDIAQAGGSFEQAISYYLKVYTGHKDEIQADDAVYNIAKVYEEKLNDDQKAAEYYKKLLFEFKGSLYSIEAREKFRKISGTSFDNKKEFKKIDMP